jgi:hypothetical protein
MALSLRARRVDVQALCPVREDGYPVIGDGYQVPPPSAVT